MKKIGLIGGTGPESTLIYYKELNTRINKKLKDKAFPEIAIESVDLVKALKLCYDEKYDELADYLNEKIRNLQNGGVEILGLTSATMHLVWDKIQKDVKVPFISVPESAAEFAVKKGYKKVGLIGTIFTMSKDYVTKPFMDKGIDVVLPLEAEKILVNERITKEFEYGEIKPESVKEVVSVINRMKNEDGIEAIILGCTELPLAINENNSPVPCLDIMEIHIEKLVELAC